MIGHRILFTAVVTVAAGGLTWLFRGSPDQSPSDFAQVWFGARAWLEGANPYERVGPGLAFDWPYPLLYPFTAILSSLPFVWLPLRLADAIFVAFGAGLLAWGLTRNRLHDPRILVFLSLPFLYVIQTSQWSPLLVGAILTQSFGWLLATKPTLGLALLVWRWDWRPLMVSGGFVVLSILLWPLWFASWLPTLDAAPHITAPLMRPWGWLLLLNALGWRTPACRYLLALSCLPQPPLFYEGVAVWLIVQSWAEATLLWVTSLVTWRLMAAGGPYASHLAVMETAGEWMIPGAYLPATAIALWHAVHRSGDFSWRSSSPG